MSEWLSISTIFIEKAIEKTFDIIYWEMEWYLRKKIKSSDINIVKKEFDEFYKMNNWDFLYLEDFIKTQNQLIVTNFIGIEYINLKDVINEHISEIKIILNDFNKNIIDFINWIDNNISNPEEKLTNISNQITKKIKYSRDKLERELLQGYKNFFRDNNIDINENELLVFTQGGFEWKEHIYQMIEWISYNFYKIYVN